MYHDVVPEGEPDASGFPGAGPARYKLDSSSFEEHLRALEALGRPAATPFDPASDRAGAWALTFDDGGSSAREIGARLAEHGWRGHFFVTTDLIGRPGFLSAQDVLALHDLRHVVGTHSCSHPKRMSALPWETIVEEWRRSAERLSELLGSPVDIGSVPGGYYSVEVGRAAAAAGLRVLFTSEPVSATRRVEGCLVVGRFAVLRGMPAETVAALAAGRWRPAAAQRATWNARRLAKAVGGDGYVRARTRLLERRASGQG
jgi:peptidoglycan/xylan/chitin deacetylase (PgdA/CDA1 family)